MFNIEQYPSILFHFKKLSRIFKKNNSGWYEMFCPYCDDATRKANPNHGHFNLASDYPFAHCFRCGHRSSLVKVLIDTGFNDVAIIQEISKHGNIIYSSNKKISLVKENQVQLKLINNCNSFMKDHVQDFITWKTYIDTRCGDIDPIEYGLTPNYISNKLVVQIFNNSGKIVTNRFIHENDKRYFIPPEKPLYYFQDILSIVDYKNIIFCEGAFDLINLHRYSTMFDNAFYIAIGGSNYKQAICSILSNFLLIGNYCINVIFDKNVNNKIQLMNYITNSAIILNPSLEFNFYEPMLYKDVSDCILLESL